ncbi:MAG: TraB/GumN family protein [Hymenobacter sp.]|nr:MAG: TraB/GumN family protein [Hymenobacter sp.]
MTDKLLVILGLLYTLLHPASAQNTILWKISRVGSPSISYVLGTYHQMGNSFIDSLPVIKQKLLDSEIVIFESIDTSFHARELINKRPTSLLIDQVLPAMDIEFIKSQNWSVDIYKLRPAELLIKLEQEYYKTHCNTVKSSDKWQHTEDYLISIASRNKKTLMALETDSLQLALINQNQDQEVVNKSSWRSVKGQIHHWIDKWSKKQSDDKECLFANSYMKLQLDYALDKVCPNDKLVTDRNREWIKILPTIFEKHKAFVAIGLFHLYYQCGMLEQLRQAGFTVEPVLSLL